MKLSIREELVEGDYVVEMYDRSIEYGSKASVPRNWALTIGYVNNTVLPAFTPLWYITGNRPNFSFDDRVMTYAEFTYYVLTEEEVMEHVVLETI